MLAILPVATAQDLSLPPIVSRAEWGAKPMLPGAKPHTIRWITIHHTGTPTKRNRSLKSKLQGLQAFSQREDKLDTGKTKPAWPDIPYHFYIDWQGTIGEGREAGYAGDTNTSYDPTGHLLIVLEGNFMSETPTTRQLLAVDALTVAMARKYGVPPDRVKGHLDYASTDCPGKNLYPRLEGVRDKVGASR